MFIVFGTRTGRETSSAGNFIANGCPNCGNDLVPMEYVKRFTLFFIPTFRIDTVARVLSCKHCKKDYDLTHSQYFTNRALVSRFSEAQLQLFQAEFTMSIIASILVADGRSQEAKELILQKYVASLPDMQQGLQVYYDEIKNLDYNQLANEHVQRYYGICKDNFQDGFQGRILWRALQFIKTNELTLSDAGTRAQNGLMRNWGYQTESEIKMLE